MASSENVLSQSFHFHFLDFSRKFVPPKWRNWAKLSRTAASGGGKGALIVITVHQCSSFFFFIRAPGESEDNFELLDVHSDSNNQ